MSDKLRDAGPYIGQPVNAGNDASGAPRRGIIVYGELSVSGIVLPVGVREYRRMVREWGA